MAGNGDKSLDGMGPFSNGSDTRDDHPILASQGAEASTDGPRTRSLTGGGKMADRSAATGLLVNC